MTEVTIEAPSRLDDGSNGSSAGGSAPGWGWAFIDQTELGANGWQPYTVSLLRIVFYPLIFSILVVWAFGARGHVPPVAMAVALFGSLIAGGAAVVHGVVRSHRRPWLSLISPSLRIDWRRLAIGAAIQAVLVLPLFFLPALATEPPWRLPSGSFWIAAVALIMTPLQAASEEIVFRGYLTQALGRIFRSRDKIIVIVAAVFAALHYGSYGPLTLPFIFIVSLTWSLASLRDGRLELVIGAHTMQNWLSIGSVAQLASAHPQVPVTWLVLVGTAVYGVVFYAASRWLVGLLSDKRPEPVSA